MTRVASGLGNASELRRRAEEIIEAAASGKQAGALPEDVAAVLHELRVHQVELEMQNEEFHRVQEDLAASEERYLDLYEFAPVGYLSMDADGVILQANLTLASLLHKSKGRLVGKQLGRFVVPEDQDVYYEFRRRVAAPDSGPQSCEVRLSVDGTVGVWVRLDAVTTSSGADGSPLTRVTVADITERKQAEHELRRSEEKFAAAFHVSPDLLAITRLSDGEILEVNDAYERMLGYTRAESVGRTTAELSIWADPADRAEFVRRLTETCEVLDFETTLRRKDGSTVVVIDSARSFDLRGEKSILSVAHDITERKETERRLRESEARFRRLAENAPDAIYRMSLPYGAYEYMSPAASSIFGYSPEEFYATPRLIREVIHPDWRKFFDEQWAALIRGETPPMYDYQIIHKSGKVRWLNQRNILVRDSTGSPTAIEGIVTDITQRKTAEENIRRLNRIYAVLSGINEAIVHLHEPQSLFEEACRVAVEDGGFIAAWIGLVDPADNRVRVVAQAGATEGYLDGIEIIVGHETLGRGPTGRSISERRHVFSHDIEHDPAMAPWRDNALRQGYRSSASFPLIVGDEAVGSFTMYADAPEFFVEQQLVLLDELAADVSFAIEAAEGEERRERAEEGLLESEDRFKNFFDRSVVPMSMTPPTGAAHMNDAFCAMLGYTHEELSDKATWTQLTYPDDVADTQLQMDRLVSGERASARYEKRFVRKDGGIVWTDVSSSLRHDAEGQPLYFMTTFVDITGRKNDETELEHRGAQLVELADERERNLEQLARSFSSLIEVICQVVEIRDPYTAGHQRRVSELAVRISEEMGMPAEQVEEIRVAALIHDVGKMSVPAEILTKPGKLSHSEFELIKDHSEAGYRIIESAHMEGSAAETVFQHHERCDGSGYPRGLMAEQLLPNAKVLMVADVVEAMTSHRPYRAALGMDAALEEIEGGAGRLYDSEVCKACVAVCRDGGFAFSA